MNIKINTKDFGEMEFEKDEIISFPTGIYAFEDCREFVFIKKENSIFQWLQNIKDIDPRFIVLNPNEIFTNYNPEIPSGVKQQLKADNDELSLFVIAVIPGEIKDMTVNLKSPIVVNFNKRLAMQVILEGQDYPVRHQVFEDERGA